MGVRQRGAAGTTATRSVFGGTLEGDAAAFETHPLVAWLEKHPLVAWLEAANSPGNSLPRAQLIAHVARSSSVAGPRSKRSRPLRQRPHVQVRPWILARRALGRELVVAI